MGAVRKSASMDLGSGAQRAGVDHCMSDILEVSWTWWKMETAIGFKA